MIRLVIFIFTLLLSFYLGTDGFADTINLKNKRSMEGIIKKEDEQALVLDVGFGTIKIPKSDIESIERSANNEQIQGEWKEKYFEKYPAPTPEEQSLLDGFRKLRSSREGTVKKINRSKKLAREIANLEKEIPGLQDGLGKIGTRLKSTDSRKDVVKYNNLVVEFNSASNAIKSKINKLTRLREDYDNINKRISEYMEELLEFVNAFEKRRKDIATKNPTPQQQQFHTNLEKRLVSFREEFKQESISFKKSGSGILVKVVLNRSVPVTMLVDTGAGLTIIPERIATRLGIDTNSIKQDVELTVADGNKLLAKLTTLDTIKVGNSEGKNIAVAIVKNVSADFDGLLGMSFLKNFIFSVDARQQKLILNSFSPK